MKNTITIGLEPSVDLAEATLTLELVHIITEIMFGEGRWLIECHAEMRRDQRAVVFGWNEVSRFAAVMFHGLCKREFGEGEVYAE